MSTTQSAPILVIGIGNEFRGDDAVGLLAIERVRRLHCPRVETITLNDHLDSLLDLWTNYELVVLVDAVCTGAETGTIYCRDLLRQPLPHTITTTSTHSLDPLQLVQMARLLNRSPRRLYLVGIEGCDFAIGASVSHDVHAALPTAVDHVLSLFHQVGVNAVE
jgi:hydrogenase maturation protease